MARLPDAVFLLAEDGADALWAAVWRRGLYLPPLAKLLLWTSAHSPRAALDRFSLPRWSSQIHWLCFVQFGVLVTVPNANNGTTVVLPSRCEESQEKC